MITIGFQEEGQSIKNLMSHFFKCWNVPYSLSTETDKDFVLLNPGSTKLTHFDVLLQDTVKKEPMSCKADYIHIINSDDCKLELMKGRALWITYGLNSYATVTASSIEQDGESIRFQYCLQRNIVSLKGKIIEWQEFPVCIFRKDISIHQALGFVTLALVCSFTAEKLVKIK